METDPLFDQAMAAIKADRHDEASVLLAQVVTANPRHEQGWLWLAGVVDDLNQSIDCLNRVLQLNPSNVKAQEWLAFAESEKQKEIAQGAASAAEAYPRAISRLGVYLLDSKFITRDQLDRALQTQRVAKILGESLRLGEVLVEQGAITRERLELALRQQRTDFNNQFRD